jgi:hypothetical protein
MVKKFLKKILPEPIKRALKAFYDRYKRRRISRVMRRVHKNSVDTIKNKEKIKVVFLAIHGSVWKVDSVFSQMVRDPYFVPEILVCPYVVYGEDKMLRDMNESFQYFKNKGYPVRKSLKNDGTWLSISDICPDVVVFTNPYKLTRPEYYSDVYLRYLTIYVPYYYMATNHAGDIKKVLDTPMLNAMWRIYWPHRYVSEKFNTLSQVKGKNSKLTGYPATEALLSRENGSKKVAWKTGSSKNKKIIYAPHHSISDDESSLSTFLQLGLSVKKIAVQYNERVQWSFKPHPILKSNLYLHPAWGKERTDKYYEFWASQEYTQLDEGEYDDLFVQSDAIIHDCSSFIVEYAVTKKPALYLLSRSSEGLEFLNDFGKCAFQTHQTARSASEINKFILGVLECAGTQEKRENTSFDEYLSEFYNSEMPSDRIIKDIKVALGAPVN